VNSTINQYVVKRLEFNYDKYYVAVVSFIIFKYISFLLSFQRFTADSG